MMDIGVSAAAAEQTEKQQQMYMEQLSVGSAYVEFQKSVAWKDMREAMDIEVAAAEAAIIEAAPGESLEKKRDNFVAFQVWKKVRMDLESRVNYMTEHYKDYIKETTQHGNDHA